MEFETGGRGLPSKPASVLRCSESGFTAFKRKEAAAEVEAAAFSQGRTREKKRPQRGWEAIGGGRSWSGRAIEPNCSRILPEIYST